MITREMLLLVFATIPGGAWKYYAQHPEESRTFNEAMTGKAHGQIAGILAGYDFSPFETIADWWRTRPPAAGSPWRSPYGQRTRPTA